MMCSRMSTTAFAMSPNCVRAWRGMSAHPEMPSDAIPRLRDAIGSGTRRRHAAPRDEPPHVLAGSTAVRVDREAHGLHGSLGVAIRATAAGNARPGRLEQVLHPRTPGTLGPHVLEH